ncbi:MAG: hypothetical protein NTY71_01705 [Methanoregula sp.]|nr:hypothetical protein [Methanoregula sp.]
MGGKYGANERTPVLALHHTIVPLSMECRGCNYDLEAKIDSAKEACNLEESTVREVKRAIGISDQLKASFDDISSLPTQTVLELEIKRDRLKEKLPKTT